MPTNAHPSVLDREEARSLVQEHLAPQLDLFEQLTNYGSMLIVRLVSTRRDLAIRDAIVIGVFLRQIVAMLDSFTVLFKEGAGHAAYLSSRSMYEASLFSEWMLAANLEQKANYYYVQCIRDERKWTRRGIRDNDEESHFIQSMREFGIDIHENRPFVSDAAEEKLTEIGRVLAQPQLRTINDEFEAAMRGRQERYWYQLLDQPSIRSLARSLDRLVEYDVFYSKAATIHHASKYSDHFRFADGRLHIESIRHLRYAAEQVNFTGQLALRSFTNYLRYYRPGELASFRRIYSDEWREAYLNVPTINYAPE